jgi:WD40 repeat protein
VTRYERGETNHRWPFLLPDGRHVLFQVLLTDPAGGNVREIRVLDLEAMGQRMLLRTDSHAQFANGYLFYVQQGNLMAQRFDDSSLTASGAPVALAEQVDSFTVGPSGLLAFQGGAAATTELVWYARDGKETGQVGGPGLYSSVSLSPDGSKAAASVVDPQTRKRDIWVFDVARGTPARVTVGGTGANYPIWDRDGSRVVYWDGEGGGGIYAKPVSGLGASQLVKKEAAPVGMNAMSYDGKLLAYMTNPGSNLARLWVRELAPEKSDGKDRPLLGSNFLEATAQFSPDGGWLAYTSFETGTREVYVVSFPSLSTKVQISTSGGSQPRWRGDGKELFYLGLDENMTAVGLDMSGGSLTPGTPKVLFQTRALNTNSADYGYDVTADGRRFLIRSLPPKQDLEPITVYANWAEALKK